DSMAVDEIKRKIKNKDINVVDIIEKDINNEKNFSRKAHLNKQRSKRVRRESGVISEEPRITLKAKYSIGNLIVARSDKEINYEDYVDYPTGYTVQAYILKGGKYLPPEEIAQKKLTEKLKINYMLLDNNNEPVKKSNGQVVTNNLDIYFYDPTPVLKKIEEVTKKIEGGDYENEEEVIGNLEKIKEKVEQPKELPKIPEILMEVQEEDGKLLKKQPENTKYSPSTKPVEKPFGEAPSEEEVTSKVTVPGYPTDAAKQPTFKVTDPSTLPDGKTAGKTDVSVTVTYPDGTTEEVTVPVTVGEQPENENPKISKQQKVLDPDKRNPDNGVVKGTDKFASDSKHHVTQVEKASQVRNASVKKKSTEQKRGQLPETGDETNAPLFATLFGALGATLLFTKRRKTDEQ
ncbi:TPA: LPXTG cell wall anchor domain-containing protein, partial [Staphylococcus aureus]|nr:LPXTG cell wall anchor domain-containing protein [Staphylococcus aureus]